MAARRRREPIGVRPVAARRCSSLRVVTRLGFSCGGEGGGGGGCGGVVETGVSTEASSGRDRVVEKDWERKWVCARGGVLRHRVAGRMM